MGMFKYQLRWDNGEEDIEWDVDSRGFYKRGDGKRVGYIEDYFVLGDAIHKNPQRLVVKPEVFLKDVFDARRPVTAIKGNAKYLFMAHPLMPNAWNTGSSFRGYHVRELPNREGWYDVRLFGEKNYALLESSQQGSSEIVLANSLDSSHEELSTERTRNDILGMRDKEEPSRARKRIRTILKKMWTGVFAGDEKRRALVMVMNEGEPCSVDDSILWDRLQQVMRDVGGSFYLYVHPVAKTALRWKDLLWTSQKKRAHQSPDNLENVNPRSFAISIQESGGERIIRPYKFMQEFDIGEGENKRTAKFTHLTTLAEVFERV